MTRHVRVRSDASYDLARCLKVGDDDEKDDDDDPSSSSRLLLVDVNVQSLVHLIISSSRSSLLQGLHELIQLANLLVYQ